MARLKIVRDVEFLHKKSKQVTDFDARLHQLIDDMRDTLKHANGAGLAAVQVGVLYRVCLVVTDKEMLELVNPEFISKEKYKIGEEACLSIPRFSIDISRPNCVKVRAQDRFGNFFEKTLEGIAAVCACHEIDHLDGVIISDHAQEGARS